MNRAPANVWKYYIGLTLFGYSLTTFPLAALAPFLFSPALATTVAMAIVVSGEIGFRISAAILGKPFVGALKAKVRSVMINAPVVGERDVADVVIVGADYSERKPHVHYPTHRNDSQGRRSTAMPRSWIRCRFALRRRVEPDAVLLDPGS